MPTVNIGIIALGIIALGIIAVFFVVYLKKRNAILVLVINVSKENIIQILRIKGQVESENCEELYAATQYLWMGFESDFFKNFKSWFDKKELPEEQQSEYDVYLVKIPLKHKIPGFESSNANSLVRLDAFRQLPDNSREGELVVSHRLANEAYANNNLYRR
ncbi:MAG: hypothetical protein HC815_07520 [Richelia sp. RM1_1_1]|nr:hypothetical protein [Calothrix sp. SM1_7_51]NJN07836.1 hypothetical protein [Richelia sp. RM1_1_1]